MIDRLPPSLEIAEIPYLRQKVDDVQASRAKFSKKTKQSFLQFLAGNYAGDLHEMGISEAGMNMMMDGEFPRNTPGEQLDCSIDHIISLNFGGTNDFDNLMLIPARFNAMKNKLETSQLTDAVKGTVKTIVPVDGKKVPFIEGGFQRMKLVSA